MSTGKQQPETVTAEGETVDSDGSGEWDVDFRDAIDKAQQEQWDKQKADPKAETAYAKKIREWKERLAIQFAKEDKEKEDKEKEGEAASKRQKVRAPRGY